MCSDASKLGFGATFNRMWIQGKFPVSWKGKDITVLELFPIYVMLNMFGSVITNNTVLFLCDNIAIVNIINKQSSKDSFLLSLVRKIVLILVKFNIHLISQHIAGRNNTLCDKLSRFQETRAFLDQANMNQKGTKIPNHLLPEHYVE